MQPLRAAATASIGLIELVLGGMTMALRRLFMPTLRLLFWAVLWMVMVQMACTAARAELQASLVTALPEALTEAARAWAERHAAAGGASGAFSWVNAPPRAQLQMQPGETKQALRDDAWPQSVHDVRAWLADQAVGVVWRAGLEILARRGPR